MNFFLSVLCCSGFIGGAPKPTSYNSWQFSFGKAVSQTAATWDFGFGRYSVNNRKIYRYGIDASFYLHRFSQEIDFTKNYQEGYHLETGVPSMVNEFYSDQFYRLKPYFGIGKKMIRRKRYYSDISFDFGAGLNIFRRKKADYYILDTTGMPLQPKLHYNGVENNFSAFHRSDVFLGIRNTHYFNVRMKGRLFLDFLLAFDRIIINGRNRSSNSVYLQAKLGFSFTAK